MGGLSLSVTVSSEVHTTHLPVLRLKSEQTLPSLKRNTLIGDSINPWMRSHAANQLLKSQGRDKSLFFWNPREDRVFSTGKNWLDTQVLRFYERFTWQDCQA